MAFKLAELIIRIGAEGVERVRASLRQIRGDVKDVGDEAARTGRRAKTEFQVPFESAMKTVAGFTGALGAGAGVVGGVFGGAAVTAALGYAELEARLKAVTGSAETAARKLQYAQAVANPSNFTFTQLANATVTLEAFGVNAERALGTVARLGMAFGAGDEQLQMLVRALGDISAGSFPEKDVMASFGLNRQMFAEQGIEFDGQGQLQSSAVETLEALERIVLQRYGGIFDEMADTPGAKVASLQDGWEKLLRVIGDGVLERAGPSLEYLSRLINGLTGSDVLFETVERFNAGLARLFNFTPGEGLIRFLAGTLSIIGTLPDYIKAVYDNANAMFGNAISNIREYFREAGDWLSSWVSLFKDNMAIMGQAWHLLLERDIAGAIEKLGQLSATPTDPVFPAAINPLTQGTQPLPNLMGQSQEYFERIMAAMKPTDADVPEARGPFLLREVDATRDSLEKIERNTRDTADAITLRRQAMGGGEMGRLGVTPQEMFGGPAAGPPASLARRFAGTGDAFWRDLANAMQREVDRRVLATVNSGRGSGYRAR